MANNTVIIVPGITGSALSYSYLSALIGSVWVNPSVLIAGGFPRMRLAVPSESLAAPFPPVDTPGPALSFYYGTLASGLLVRGWNSTWPIADWRKPIAHDAAILAALIRNKATSGPLKVVCHSRGGLVTRAALAMLGATDGPNLVSRVVGMGVPHTGSLQAAAMVSADNGATRLTRELASVFPGGLVTSYLTGLITSVTRSWPAVYELMPAPGAPWLTGLDAARLYQPATWAASATTPVAQYLTDAAATWAALAPVPSWVDWIDVASDRLTTSTGINSIEDLVVRGELNNVGDGDGTVPFGSAHQTGRRVLKVPTSHSSLPIDPRVIVAVHTLLADGLTADAEITGYVLNVI